MTAKPKGLSINELFDREQLHVEITSLRAQIADPAYVRVLRSDLEAFMAANAGWDATPAETKRLRAAVKGDGK